MSSERRDAVRRDGRTVEGGGAVRGDGTAIKLGDVVYFEGSSAILGDVVGIVEGGFVVVVWRETTTTEDVDDLILEGEKS